MTRIDFYILTDLDELARQRFACRIACRAVADGQRVFVRAPEAHAEAFDDLLWDYPPDRFLPHARLGAESSEPVVIGAPEDLDRERAAADAGHGDAQEGVLVNLAPDIPKTFARFGRVSEIVLASERAAGRAKYRQYRERGYPLFHHELDDWE